MLSHGEESLLKEFPADLTRHEFIHPKCESILNHCSPAPRTPSLRLWVVHLDILIIENAACLKSFYNNKISWSRCRGWLQFLTLNGTTVQTNSAEEPPKIDGLLRVLLGPNSFCGGLTNWETVKRDRWSCGGIPKLAPTMDEHIKQAVYAFIKNQEPTQYKTRNEELPICALLICETLRGALPVCSRVNYEFKSRREHNWCWPRGWLGTGREIRFNFDLRLRVVDSCCSTENPPKVVR